MILDGVSYEVFQTHYGHSRTKINSSGRTLTGDVSRTETGIVQHRYDIQLICQLSELTNLQTSFAKVTSPTNLLSFTDEEGTVWDGTVTGVYFENKEIQPITVTGWSSKNRFVVPIVLVGKSIRNPSDLLTESGLTIYTESGLPITVR